VSHLPIGYSIAYLVEVTGLTWRGDDYTARNIVRGLKGEPFNGYSDLIVGGVSKRFTSKNIHEAVDIILERFGVRLRAHVRPPLTIVPVPNSDMVLGNAIAGRITSLAHKVAAGYGQGATVNAAIRWRTAKEKAHNSRQIRNPNLYYPNLQLVGSPTGNVVLFDDVFTTGSQATACAWILDDARRTPCFGMFPAKAFWSQTTPFGWRTDTLWIGRNAQP
jgi:hypothetical protein